MSSKKKKKKAPGNVVAQNRKARHDFLIEDTFEAGIVLHGSEVKSLRRGQASIADAYASEVAGELYLLNAHIPEYAAASYQTHEPKRQRKLLMHKRELAKLFLAINRQGMTLVPLTIYFNGRGMAKVELALARGKQKVDKRQAMKEQDWKRDKARLMRHRG